MAITLQTIKKSNDTFIKQAPQKVCLYPDKKFTPKSMTVNNELMAKVEQLKAHYQLSLNVLARRAVREAMATDTIPVITTIMTGKVKNALLLPDQAMFIDDKAEEMGEIKRDLLTQIVIDYIDRLLTPPSLEAEIQAAESE